MRCAPGPVGPGAFCMRGCWLQAGCWVRAAHDVWGVRRVVGYVLFGVRRCNAEHGVRGLRSLLIVIAPDACG